MPLNPMLSVCTNIPGVTVSFVDATPDEVLGTVRLNSRNDVIYIFNVAWNVTSSLEDYAMSHAQEIAADAVLQEPSPVVVQGMPAIRYNFPPSSDSPTVGLPRMALFIQTGAGIATFIGSPKQDGVTAEDLYIGAESAAKILHASE